MCIKTNTKSGRNKSLKTPNVTEDYEWPLNTYVHVIMEMLSTFNETNGFNNNNNNNTKINNNRWLGLLTLVPPGGGKGGCCFY